MRMINAMAFVLTSHAALGHDKAQNIIDQITQAYESGGGPPPGGFGFTAASLGAPPPGFGELGATSQISCRSFVCIPLDRFRRR